MVDHNVLVAKNYYRAMNDKSLSEVEKFVHPDVHFVSPMGEVAGKENMLKAAKGFMTIFDSIIIHAAFGSDDQAIVIYDISCPAPIGGFRTAAFMNFKDGLISRLELFYDARPFEKKQ